ncbi:hypothetical protein SAMN02745216_04835 [Desulfatibacillum alkenivorans DSM 16219]|uniref:BMC circularly permuted domain-containing protein n=1 Tax=Desulfatibacillum alkenivorans DSM 16219 TaxID=1121393 RepID=A0A1M6YUC1_9BACT|nr:hypothetical protein [Desulfatibacillum alkenivorans]SHL21629.1 hypothetical protein SAMN02745216_04835 [Desulfatibacillum alkenivorans DSM 16219]
MNSLRAYAFIDRLQPQLAGVAAASSPGFLPIGGESSLVMEVQPGILINQAIDLALKASPVKLGKSLCERYFGYMEIHAKSQQDVLYAGSAALKGLGFTEKDITKPEVLSSLIINKVSPYHAQLMNVYRNGSLLIPGKDLLTVECEPAAYIFLAANEVEKQVDVTLVDCVEVGAVGRLSVSGTPSEIKQAEKAAVQALKAVQP